MLASRVQQFLDHLKVERRLAANTLAAYASDLHAFLLVCEQEGVSAACDVRPVHISRWLQSLSKAKRAPTSQSRALSAVRQFFLFLVRESVLSSDPTKDIQGPKHRRKLPVTMSRNEAQRLVEAPVGSEPRAIRNRAALELLYAAGLRASELCTLRLDDVHLGLGVVRPTGKGGKERVVPLGKPAQEALQRYLGEARPLLTKGKSSVYVFAGKRGRPLTRMTLYNIVRQATLEAGLGRTLSPHKLRHAFATHLLQGGADLRVVQEMLGHASISTTEIYTHVTADHLANTVNKHHPLGRG